jgi:4-amino-4-deoxy-L-arabinose transferase-like glycosyltransferase
MAAALVLRTVALIATRDIACLYDECFYSELARQLAAGQGFQPHARHFWPPGYIAFLAAHLAAGGGFLAAKASQVLLSTLLVPLVYYLGLQAARGLGAGMARRTGLIAAAWIAFDPNLIAYSHYLWSETLFLPLFTGALLFLADAGDSGSTRRAAAAGALLGLAGLIKVLPVYLVPILAIWLVARSGRHRRGLRPAVALVIVAFAVIAPWTIRNVRVHGRFVLVETTIGKNLVRGNNPREPSNWDWGMNRSARGVLRATGCNQADLVELNACLTRKGAGHILSRPGRFARRAVTKLADLASPTSFLVRHARQGVYGDWPGWLTGSVVTLVALFNMALLALAVVGWIHAPPGPVRQLVTLTTLYVLVVHVITFAMSRFRLPVEPLMAVGAALALAGPGALLASFRSGRRRWAAAALLVLLAGLWSARLGSLYYEPPAGVSPPGDELGPVER